jgi:hypothetical protein
LTQVGRALARLGVEHIPAYSPEARGRSERLFGILQDRLIKELALAGICEPEAANRFIREVYLPEHNTRFARPAELPESAFVPVKDNDLLSEVLCVEEERIVARDNTVSWGRLRLQLPEAGYGPTTSRRACACTNTPTARSPSSTGRAAWPATAPTARRSRPPSKPPRDPLRRDALLVWRGFKAPPHPTQPRRTTDVLPIPDKSECYRQPRPSCASCQPWP